MPGRPRTTLKHIDGLLQRVEAYGSDLLELMPKQYLERPNTRDHTCAAWRRAAESAAENYKAIVSLRDVIAEKADRAERLAAIMGLDQGDQ